jgi:hypothetical protein
MKSAWSAKRWGSLTAARPTKPTARPRARAASAHRVSFRWSTSEESTRATSPSTISPRVKRTSSALVQDGGRVAMVTLGTSLRLFFRRQASRVTFEKARSRARTRPRRCPCERTLPCLEVARRISSLTPVCRSGGADGAEPEESRERRRSAVLAPTGSSTALGERGGTALEVGAGADVAKPRSVGLADEKAGRRTGSVETGDRNREDDETADGDGVAEVVVGLASGDVPCRCARGRPQGPMRQ